MPSKPKRKRQKGQVLTQKQRNFRGEIRQPFAQEPKGATIEAEEDAQKAAEAEEEVRRAVAEAAEAQRAETEAEKQQVAKAFA